MKKHKIQIANHKTIDISNANNIDLALTKGIVNN